MGISLMGSQNVCFVLDFYLPVQCGFERSLLAPKSLEMRMVREIQDLYKKNFIIIYILELMYDMVGEPYPARSWNPSQSVILTVTYFECHLPRWAFLKWISPHTQIQIHKYTNTNILSRWLFLQWSSPSQPWGVWGSLKLRLWKLVRYPPPPHPPSSSHHHHHRFKPLFAHQWVIILNCYSSIKRECCPHFPDLQVLCGRLEHLPGCSAVELWSALQLVVSGL